MTCNDWGLWRTVTGNLAQVAASLIALSAALAAIDDSEDLEHMAGRPQRRPGGANFGR